ncbi:U BOX DOMAIN-CONTAINING [Salix viminalis]|uniref:U BOX DOMAIN-CONTAINING n=1 Tax=Salix viminalis TaxID=40686 RepID=A0A9Q0UHQ3_SALVM|nr:U BOX DOMAIN-CONTAINING [Salix viminalis]
MAMEKENSANFTYMGRSFSELTVNDDSLAFSDCNSDKSGEFPASASQSRRLFLSCAADNPDDLIRQLLQEYGVTAILNLSLCDENKGLIVSSGAIKPLVRALKTGTSTAKENAACALLRLSQLEENKVAIGRSGAIPLLSAFVLSMLVTVPEAKTAVVEEEGIPVLVEIVEVGSQRQKEIAVSILLQICEDNILHCSMVAREGAIPPLVALSQSGTNRAKQKAEALIELLRQLRSGNAAAKTSDVSV